MVNWLVMKQKLWKLLVSKVYVIRYSDVINACSSWVLFAKFLSQVIVPSKLN